MPALKTWGREAAFFNIKRNVAMVTDSIKNILSSLSVPQVNLMLNMKNILLF